MKGMEMLRRSSVFAAEVMEVFDRSPTDKELVSQSKVLCRDYIHSRLHRAGIGWSKPEHGSGTLAEVSSVLLWLGRTSDVSLIDYYCLEIAMGLHVGYCSVLKSEYFFILWC